MAYGLYKEMRGGNKKEEKYGQVNRSKDSGASNFIREYLS